MTLPTPQLVQAVGSRLPPHLRYSAASELPECLTRLLSGTSRFRQNGRVLTTDVWPEDSNELEDRLRSVVAVAEFARKSPDLHVNQRKRLVNEAIWFWTERGSVSRKYRLRFRTPAALKLQNDLGYSAAAKGLAHEHVHERAAMVVRLLRPDTDIKAVMQAADACVVTKAEHQLLSSLKGVTGWGRYPEAGLHPLDMVTGLPMDLPAALEADKLAWPERA